MDDALFLRTIRDHPEDESNWLIYADWLEENGDPRSEVLRILSFVGAIDNLQYYQKQHDRFEMLRSQFKGEWLDTILRLRALQVRPYEHSGMPGELDIDGMWRDLDIQWVSRKKRRQRPQHIKTALAELEKADLVGRLLDPYWTDPEPWGDLAFEQLTLRRHPVLTWFGSRRRWHDMQLLPRLASSPVVCDVMFDTTPYPLDELLARPDWEVHSGPATTFADAFGIGTLAHIAATRFEQTLYGERLSEIHYCFSNEEWAQLPRLLTQQTWVFIDPADWSLAILSVVGRE